MKGCFGQLFVVHLIWCGSIAENLQMLGVDMPGIVDDTIEKFNKKEGDSK